jgi:type IV pilus assembly protein PilF
MRLEATLRSVAVVLIGAALTACFGGKDYQRKSETKVETTQPITAKDDPKKAAEINLGLGRGYLENGKTQIALEKLTKALELDPKLAPAHTLVAVVYEQIGQLQDAELHYRRAVELAPKSGSMHNNLGAFLCHQRKFDEAQAQFDLALADPFYETPEVALSNRGQCARGAGNIELAEQAYRAALKRKPDLPDALIQLAVILANKGDALHARAFLQRYEAIAQMSAESLELCMQVETKLGNETGAREYRARLIAQFPDSDQAQRLGAENTP